MLLGFILPCLLLRYVSFANKNDDDDNGYGEQSMRAKRDQSRNEAEQAENIMSRSAAVSGCHRNRPEWEGEILPLPLPSHALMANRPADSYPRTDAPQSAHLEHSLWCDCVCVY